MADFVVFLLAVMACWTAQIQGDTYIGCEKERLVFKCSDKMAPDIISATWGRQDGASCPPTTDNMSCTSDVTDKVRDKCQMVKCAFIPNKRSLGEPCAGSEVLIIKVEYQCRPETTAAPTITTITTTSAPCKAEWELFQGSCYLFLEEGNQKWDGAKAACQEKNAHLVTVQSIAEQEFLAGVITRLLEAGGSTLGGRKELWWTAGRQIEDGSWIWDDDTGTSESVDDSLWGLDQPNNFEGSQDRITLWYKYGIWGLNDLNHGGQGYSVQSICEYEHV